MPIGKSNGTVATTVGIAPEVSKTAPAPVAGTLNKRPLETAPTAERKESGTGNPYEAKDRRILRQGVYQAVLQSPGLAALPFADEAGFLKLVERVSEEIIVKVQR